MPRLIKDNQIVEDQWQRVAADDITDELLKSDADLLLPAAWYAEHSADVSGRSGRTGIWLAASEEPRLVAATLGSVDTVAIDFPNYKDGRGYSYARELRTRFNFTGEIRAVGDVLQDQLFYMWRCGFNAFEVREDKDINDALAALKGFSVTYQGDARDPRPLFARHG